MAITRSASSQNVKRKRIQQMEIERFSPFSDELSSEGSASLFPGLERKTGKRKSRPEECTPSSPKPRSKSQNRKSRSEDLTSTSPGSDQKTCKGESRTKSTAYRAQSPRPPPIGNHFGLIQETIAHNLYHLCVQAILWNQTTGRAAKPVFDKLLDAYPTPADLAAADLSSIAKLLLPIGLFNIRAVRLINMGKVWTEIPPSSETSTVRKGYPTTPSTSALPRLVDGVTFVGRKGKVSYKSCETFEICHLPGMGPYALDSYRIFHRDELRGVASDWLGTGAENGDFEPEWKRVLPLDKELRPYLKWLWRKEGWYWNWENGEKVRIEVEAGDIAEPLETEDGG